MKQIGLAISMYENSNQGAFPPSLDILVSAENLPPQALTCPDVPSGQTESYVLVPPGHDGGTGVEAYEPISNHHDGANFSTPMAMLSSCRIRRPSSWSKPFRMPLPMLRMFRRRPRRISSRLLLPIHFPLHSWFW